jgi:carboxypeptidase C (cathepsin A)
VDRSAPLVFLLVAAACCLAGQGRGQRQPGAPPATEAAREQPSAQPPVGPQPPSTPQAAQQFPAPPAVERLSKTQHSIVVKGQTIPYTATAGTLVLRREDEKPLASIFFVAYTRDGVPDKSKRPITFTFNGGPGSSSVWLHLGAFGPRRVAMPPDGTQPAPPYQLTDNENTPLVFTDLVFIDPVTTGFSRHAPGENPAQFHSVEGDLDSVADFIRLYTTRFERWESPKFLAGESYGTTRAAGLSQVLLQRGIYLNGVTLISSILNFATTRFEIGNDLPYVLFLPTYTATAWYHKKLAPDLGDLQKAINESRRFAASEYALALLKGDKITPQERTSVARQLARLTGLSQKYIDAANLRVSIARFTKELLRDQRRTVGRYDSRLEGIDLDAAGERAEYDPSYAAVQGAFTAMFNQYVRADLKYESDLPYEILTGKVQPWNYGRYQNQYLNVAEGLRQAMTQNPNLRVLIVNGYYDLATPFFATEYTVNHLGLDPTLASHVSLAYCDAGHMLYTKKVCLDKLSSAMAALYQAALGPAPAEAGTGGREPVGSH